MGKEKEEKAAAYLISKGYKILEKNYLRKTGEIDIIAKSADGYLTAVEVKYRSSDRFGSPFSAVTYIKQRKIYIAENYEVFLGKEIVDEETLASLLEISEKNPAATISELIELYKQPASEN